MFLPLGKASNCVWPLRSLNQNVPGNPSTIPYDLKNPGTIITDLGAIITLTRVIFKVIKKTLAFTRAFFIPRILL
jgi:hypothetical protein